MQVSGEVKELSSRGAGADQKSGSLHAEADRCLDQKSGTSLTEVRQAQHAHKHRARAMQEAISIIKQKNRSWKGCLHDPGWAGEANAKGR